MRACVRVGIEWNAGTARRSALRADQPDSIVQNRRRPQVQSKIEFSLPAFIKRNEGKPHPI